MQKKSRKKVIKKIIMKKRFSSDLLLKINGPGTQGSDKANLMSHKSVPKAVSNTISQLTSGKSITVTEKSTDDR